MWITGRRLRSVCRWFRSWIDRHGTRWIERPMLAQPSVASSVELVVVPVRLCGRGRMQLPPQIFRREVLADAQRGTHRFPTRSHRKGRQRAFGSLAGSAQGCGVRLQSHLDPRSHRENWSSIKYPSTSSRLSVIRAICHCTAPLAGAGFDWRGPVPISVRDLRQQLLGPPVIGQWHPGDLVACHSHHAERQILAPSDRASELECCVEAS